MSMEPFNSSDDAEQRFQQAFLVAGRHSPAQGSSAGLCCLTIENTHPPTHPCSASALTTENDAPRARLLPARAMMDRKKKRLNAYRTFETALALGAGSPFKRSLTTGSHCHRVRFESTSTMNTGIGGRGARKRRAATDTNTTRPGVLGGFWSYPPPSTWQWKRRHKSEWILDDLQGVWAACHAVRSQCVCVRDEADKSDNNNQCQSKVQ